MDLLSPSNIEYTENIPYKAIDVGRKKKLFVSLKVYAFLVVQDAFFTKQDKTLFQSDETL
jgi:hypothetical protein